MNFSKLYELLDFLNEDLTEAETNYNGLFDTKYISELKKILAMDITTHNIEVLKEFALEWEVVEDSYFKNEL